MANRFRMIREGEFKALIARDNQCKAVEQFDFHYRVTIQFGFHATIDDQGFLIDHVVIDEAIQKTALAGSCEEMHLAIARSIAKAFGGRWSMVSGYKAEIWADNAPARLEYEASYL